MICNLTQQVLLARKNTLMHLNPTCIVDATDVHLQTGSPQHGSQRLNVILLDIVQKHQLVREPDSFGFLFFRILLGIKTGTATHC